MPTHGSPCPSSKQPCCPCGSVGPSTNTAVGREEPGWEDALVPHSSPHCFPGAGCTREPAVPRRKTNPVGQSSGSHCPLLPAPPSPLDHAPAWLPPSRNPTVPRLSRAGRSSPRAQPCSARIVVPVPTEHQPLADWCTGADLLLTPPARLPRTPLQHQRALGAGAPPEASNDPRSSCPSCEPHGTSLSSAHGASSVGHTGLGTWGGEGRVGTTSPLSHTDRNTARVTHTTPPASAHGPSIQHHGRAKPGRAMGAAPTEHALPLASLLSLSSTLPSNAITQWQKSA